MKLLIELYQKEMAVISLIISLTLWGLTSSYLAFQNKTKVILIGKTKESYQLIKEDSTTPKETENFIRHFLALSFNFDEKSFKKHISLAGDLMIEDLWKKKKPEFIEMASFIKRNKVTQSAEILKIQKLKSNLYEIQVRNYLFKKGILTETNKLISLSLIENERSFENPWRHSVSNVEIK